MKTRGSALAVALAALLGVLVGAVLVLTFGRVLPAQTPAAPAAAPRQAPAGGVTAGSQDAITAAVNMVGPAVVNINTFFLPPAQDPLERMLRRSLGIPTEPFPRAGQGSGVVIDGERGYILTNAHVVKGAQKVTVSLADGRQFDARVVGIDPLTEVAVVKVEGNDLPEATLGSSADLPIGSWVIAIGNPFGFENSVTVGVLSARDRQISGENTILLQDLLQTDASINPGNSGGALVDLDGRVIGMPTAVIPYAQGMGFAVSIDTAKEVAERLIETGAMPWLGIDHRSLLPQEAKQLGLPEGKGTMIFGVAPRGPADAAGLRPGDLVINIAEKPTDTSSALGKAIRSHNAGDRVDVTIIRDGKEMTVGVTLGAVPSDLGRR
ncbi:MAG TPA: trypsin-like peptidase domain-containing protein [Armatimonadota bacterium]|nr:trypsin-like peptidase domain-containing protein [Armatimonadota bacterium]